MHEFIICKYMYSCTHRQIIGFEPLAFELEGKCNVDYHIIGVVLIVYVEKDLEKLDRFAYIPLHNYIKFIGAYVKKLLAVGDLIYIYKFLPMFMLVRLNFFA